MDKEREQKFNAMLAKVNQADGRFYNLCAEVYVRVILMRRGSKEDYFNALYGWLERHTKG